MTESKKSDPKITSSDRSKKGSVLSRLNESEAGKSGKKERGSETNSVLSELNDDGVSPSNAEGDKKPPSRD